MYSSHKRKSNRVLADSPFLHATPKLWFQRTFFDSWIGARKQFWGIVSFLYEDIWQLACWQFICQWHIACHWSVQLKVTHQVQSSQVRLQCGDSQPKNGSLERFVGGLKAYISLPRSPLHCSPPLSLFLPFPPVKCETSIQNEATEADEEESGGHDLTVGDPIISWS